MKYLAYFVAFCLDLIAFIFILGAQGQIGRIIVGVVLFVASGALIAMARLRPAQTTIVQQVELSGDVNPQEITCKACGGHLSQKSVQVRGGGIFVNCEYCGAAYQLEEEPKW